MDSDRDHPGGRSGEIGWYLMNLRLRTPAFAIIAMGSGAVVLLGYFLQVPLLQDLRRIFLDWGVILAGVILIVGVINLSLVHIRKIKAVEKNKAQSLVLIVALLVTAAIALFFGPASQWSVWIFQYFLLPVETSLVGLLVVILIYALARMFYRGFSMIHLVFAGTAVLILAASAILAWSSMPLVTELRDWIIQVWALGGARAILLGVALGIVATGLRILTGADRPYEG